MSRPLGTRRGGARTLFGGRGADRQSPPDDADSLFTDEELAWEDETAPAESGAEPGRSWPARAAAPDTETVPPYARRRLIAAAGLVVLVIVGVVLGVTLSGGGGGQPATTVSTPTVQTTAPAPAATAPAPALKVTLPGGKALKQGASGAAVRRLQRALDRLGFDVGKVDGAFGPRTTAAVVAFQKQQKLAADGVVGAKTAAALNAALASG